MREKLPKRLVAWLLAAMVALVVAPSAAFAAGYAPGAIGAQEGESGWDSIADSTVVFTVFADEGDGVKMAKEFTKAEMETLSAANTTPAKYAFSSKSGATVAVATKYVTVDQLLSEAKVTFGEDDTIIAWSDSFTPNSATPNEGFGARKFFPAYDPGADPKSSDGAEATPAIVAIEYGTAPLSSGETAATKVADAQAASAYQTGSKGGLRNFWGKTDDELNADMGGNGYCNGATYLTVATPFKIYTRTGTGAKTLVKSYTAAQLKGMATAPDSGQNAPGFLFNKEGWQVGTTTSYIPIDTLLKDAGITLSAGQVFQASASDGFTTTLTYDQIKSAKNFYPATTPSAVVADGAEEVGAVLALNWATTPFKASDTETVSLDATAGAAKAALYEKAALFSQQTRIFIGLASPTDSNTGGNRFATGPVEICITTPKNVNDSSISVSGVDASYTYTGEAIEPKVTVKDGATTLKEATRKGGDYSVSYENNIAIGTAKVVITGVNAYTGTKAIEFKITGIDISKASVSGINASYAYTGKAIAPVPTVKLGSATLKANTDYAVAYKNNVNAGTATVTITGKGSYAGTITKAFAIAKTSIAKASVTLKAKTYTGKALAPAPVVKLGSKTLKSGTDYTVAIKNAKGKAVAAKNVKAAGKYTVTVKGAGIYTGTVSKTYTIAKAANTLKAAAKSKTIKVSAKKVAKKKQTIKKAAAFKITKQQGTLTFKKASGNKKITVAENGKITVKKGLAKGTYKVKVKVTAKGNANYKSVTKTVTIKIRVK